jgi:hypothetical protein
MRRTRLQFRIQTLMVVIAAAALACLWEAERRYVARWKVSLAVQAAPPMLGELFEPGRGDPAFAERPLSSRSSPAAGRPGHRTAALHSHSAHARSPPPGRWYGGEELPAPLCSVGDRDAVGLGMLVMMAIGLKVNACATKS